VKDLETKLEQRDEQIKRLIKYFDEIRGVSLTASLEQVGITEEQLERAKKDYELENTKLTQFSDDQDQANQVNEFLVENLHAMLNLCDGRYVKPLYSGLQKRASGFPLLTKYNPRLQDENDVRSAVSGGQDSGGLFGQNRFAGGGFAAQTPLMSSGRPGPGDDTAAGGGAGGFRNGSFGLKAMNFGFGNNFSG